MAGEVKKQLSIEKEMLHLSSIFQDASSRFCPSFTKGKSQRKIHGMKSNVFCHQIEVVPRIGWIKTYHAWRPMILWIPAIPAILLWTKRGAVLDDLTRVPRSRIRGFDPTRTMLDETSSGSVFCWFFSPQMWENCSTLFLCHPFTLVDGRILSGRNADNWSMVIAIRQACYLHLVRLTLIFQENCLWSSWACHVTPSSGWDDGPWQQWQWQVWQTCSRHSQSLQHP